MTRRLLGGARGAQAKEVRITGRAATSRAGGLPAGRPPPNSPGRLDYMAPELGRGGRTARTVSDSGLEQRRGAGRLLLAGRAVGGAGSAGAPGIAG